MQSQALENLFVQELEEIYDAEKQICKGLKLMSKHASFPKLKSAFATHQKQTKAHVDRLEKSFRILGEKPRRLDASGVSGVIRQCKKLTAGHAFDPSVVDAGLITNAQKIEHYEIAAYGCLRAHAEILGYREIEGLFAQSLKEEEETDALLTQIASETVNAKAAAAPYSQARTGVRHGDGTSGTAGQSGMSPGKVAVGLAVGAAISILFAPKSGRQTRGQLRDAWSDLTRTRKDNLIETIRG
jgi:ferritin-like metal-binding protein YciE